ncbi:putative OB-fold protein/acyl dehydratase [Streptacidiphilus sp. MAP12-16]|uniref:OB-fold domain-containing protein n=1 Tax=Streptacidiphilus sp. MAP12-16 TaxID=3156300 RepID=UPI003515108B
MTEATQLDPAELQAYAGRPAAVGGRALDPVNAPMIRHWCEAMGDGNPAYTGSDAVAPPAMLQAWIMAGLGLELDLAPGPGAGRGAGRGDGGAARTARSSAYDALLARLDAAGYGSVVATDCEQEYLRPLRPGQRVLFDAEIESVSARKTTALGVGHFVTTRTDLRAYDEAAGEKPEEAVPVATHRFRILKFRPAQAGVPQADSAAEPKAQPGRRPGLRPRPVVNRDNEGFWAGVAAGELRYQRCTECGTRRFPWLPGCNACGSAEWTAEAAGGQGTVYSHVTVHHPLPAAFQAPYSVALVELAEGVRIVSNIVDVPPAEVRIGLPVRLVFERCDNELTLPLFRPATPDDLPELRIPVTRTLIVAGAIASRDYQDVHHDAELARIKGAPDIFMNILTSNGLVGRYVTDWAGPQATLTGIAVRLGVPAHPGDELRFTGRMTERVTGRDGDRLTLAVTGRTHRGSHVTATVRLTTPRTPPDTMPDTPPTTPPDTMPATARTRSGRDA